MNDAWVREARDLVAEARSYKECESPSLSRITRALILLTEGLERHFIPGTSQHVDPVPAVPALYDVLHEYFRCACCGGRAQWSQERIFQMPMPEDPRVVRTIRQLCPFCCAALVVTQENARRNKKPGAGEAAKGACSWA